ncbi:GlxA family transcriptional regulator [Marinagarivorans cellulosilyticus]|uniref:HTH araC/xylS-type domain-containing protein n=1 Tax=Marinagarivorans cellulosilyticus TaxID=2721545 RepID=A0AAN1WF77_9GAMM|nr:helix-turn-helix domain-containing protein [Marinagarivorans cellulosilyticus]BCD96490.1 hypothetical protein MARGE09_P0690 [Marinagarivorans cellulosilyticus]
MPNTFRRHPLKISLLATQETSAAVLYGLHEVFSCVGTMWQLMTGRQAHTPQIAVSIAGRSSGLLVTNQGAPILVDSPFSETDNPDVIIAGDLYLDLEQPLHGLWAEEVQWIKTQHQRGAIICSVCSGSILLAETGLLDEKNATTHWSVSELFAQYYPKVNLMPEHVLLPGQPEDRIITSGGSASWSDLSLYLIAHFCGNEEARRIAKIFLFGDRNDGQLPFSAMTRPKPHEDEVVAQCQLWVANNYEVQNPVSEMIKHSGLNPRTFKRRFNKATGFAPLEYVQTLRIEEAKQMLEASNDPIDIIASNVGYDDPNSFRRLFKRSTAISPSQYRQRFQKVGACVNIQ